MTDLETFPHWYDERVLVLAAPPAGTVWRPDRITVRWHPEPWQPPDDLAPLYAAWAEEKCATPAPPFDPPRRPVRVMSAAPAVDTDGAPALALNLQPVDFRYVYAAGGNLRRAPASGVPGSFTQTSLWESAWEGDVLACPFPNSLDLHLSVICAEDGSVPLCDRGGAVLFAGRMGVTAPVGVNHVADRDHEDAPLDLLRTLRRGARAEAGVDLNGAEVGLLGLSAETGSGVCSLAAFARVPLSGERFLREAPYGGGRSFRLVPLDRLAEVTTDATLTPLSRVALALLVRNPATGA
jgi:hypothetical protein